MSMYSPIASFLKAFSGLILVFVSINVDAQQRRIGFQPDMAENAEFDSTMMHAKSACCEYIHLALDWNELDTNLGNYNEQAYDMLQIINYYFPLQQISVELNIPVINTVKREVPTDLQGEPFSSSVMIARFKKFLDTVFFYMPNLELEALTIGNESDGYWIDDTSAVIDFRIFLDSVIPYAKSKYFALHGEVLRCGTTIGFGGLTNSTMSSVYQSLNAGLDVVSLTYYPLHGDFQVHDPSIVSSHFREIVDLYPDTAQPILFAECGYPTSAQCGSSEELQRQFVRQVFLSWDSLAANIRWVTFFSLTDWPQSFVDTLMIYYGLPGDPEFGGYLGTLGLRTFTGNGANKPAFDELKCQASFRNFCSTSCTAGLNSFSSFFSLYPNPISDCIVVPTEFAGSTFSLLSMSGQLVSFGIAHESIDVSWLPAGTYILQFNLGTQKPQTTRLVKN